MMNPISAPKPPLPPAEEAPPPEFEGRFAAEEMREEQIEKLRGVVRDCVSKHLYSSAIFFADKVAAVTEDPADIYMQAQALYRSERERVGQLIPVMMESGPGSESWAAAAEAVRKRRKRVGRRSGGEDTVNLKFVSTSSTQHTLSCHISLKRHVSWLYGRKTRHGKSATDCKVRDILRQFFSSWEKPEFGKSL